MALLEFPKSCKRLETQVVRIPKIAQKAGNTDFELLKCKFTQKLKVFVTNGGFLEKKLTLFNKNYICILRKNSNPEYWVLEKTQFLEKKKPPVAMATISPPPR